MKLLNKISRLAAKSPPTMRQALRLTLILSIVALFGCKGCIEDEIHDQFVKKFDEKKNGAEPKPKPPKPNPNSGSEDFPLQPPEVIPETSPPIFEVSKILPARGPLEGGNVVRIVGGKLVEGTRIFFGTVEAQNVTLDKHDLLFAAPPGLKPGVVPIKLLLPSGASLSVDNGYYYYDRLKVGVVQPSRIPSEASPPIVVTGSGFSNPLAVSIDGQVVPHAELLSSSKIKVFPPSHPRGTVDLAVTTSSDSVLVKDAIRFVESIRSLEISPYSGPSNGGNYATLHVDGLAVDNTKPDGGVAVLFGQNRAILRTINGPDDGPKTIEVEVPAGNPGPTPVIITSIDDSRGFANAYLYSDSVQPVLLAAIPASGPNAGGNSVIIAGSGLDAPNLTVNFGPNPATITAATSDSLTVTAPPATTLNSSVAIELRAAGALVDSVADAYTYVTDAPSITSLHPPEGSELPVAGGTIITLSGANFDMVTSVDLGGVPCEITTATATELSCIAPPHSAGRVSLTVHTSSFKVTEEGTYFYLENPVIWGVSPPRGAIAGGTRVRVFGRNFNQLAMPIDVRFGDAPASSVNRLNDNVLEVVTPPGATGNVNITVKGVAETTPFEYFNPVTEDPRNGYSEIEGSLNVTVVDENGPVAGASVYIGAGELKGTPVTTNANGQVTYSHEGLSAPVTVSATAPGYSMMTIQDESSANVIILLTKSSEPNPSKKNGDSDVNYAFFYGTVTASGKATEEGAFKQIDVAYVQTSKFSRRFAGFGAGKNAMVVGMGNQYELVSHIGDQAIIAICGSYDHDTKSFVPLMLGVARQQFINDRERKRVDVDCNIPLERSVYFKIHNAQYRPQGPNVNKVKLVLDLGADGFFEMPDVVTGYGEVLVSRKMPVVAPELSDVRYIALASNETSESSNGSPLSVTETNFGAEETEVTFPPLVDVAMPLTPITGGEVGDTIKFAKSSPHLPDAWWLTLKSESGDTLYEVLIGGSQTELFVPWQMIRDRIAQHADFIDFSKPLTLSVMGVAYPEGTQYWRYSYRKKWNLSRYSFATWEVFLSKTHFLEKRP